MCPIKALRYDIAASLWHIPCKEKELKERDFLKNIAMYWVQRALQYLENDGIIYETKDGTYHTHKSALPILNKEGYELS